jgi:hypothetical protein
MLTIKNEAENFEFWAARFKLLGDSKIFDLEITAVQLDWIILKMLLILSLKCSRFFSGSFQSSGVFTKVP